MQPAKVKNYCSVASVCDLVQILWYFPEFCNVGVICHFLKKMQCVVIYFHTLNNMQICA